MDSADVASQARSALWLSGNRRVIASLARGRSDLEALASSFESRSVDDSSLRGTSRAWRRLDAILSAFESDPGVRFHASLSFFRDSGFYGTHSFSDDGFADPHPSSQNQVGHFLTAVGLGFDSSVPDRRIRGVATMRELLGAPTSMSNDGVAIALCVGHELTADADEDASAPSQLATAQRQFAEGVAHPEYLDYFRNAVEALGSDWRHPNLSAAEVWLRRIPVHTWQRGNSYQDLRLTACGFYLGRLVANGVITERAELAAFVRDVLGRGSRR